MASSSSANSSSQLQNSGSDGDLRKRKRMQSNRESARRSRMRKQKHLDELTAQMAQLRKDSAQIVTSIGVTNRHLMAVEAENQILRAQMVELNQRLQSLNEILNFIDSTNSFGGFDLTDCLQSSAVADSFVNPFNLPYLSQPIMASADMLHY